MDLPNEHTSVNVLFVLKLLSSIPYHKQFTSFTFTVTQGGGFSISKRSGRAFLDWQLPSVCNAKKKLSCFCLFIVITSLFIHDTLTCPGDDLPALPVGGASPGCGGRGPAVGRDWAIMHGRHGGPHIPHAYANHVWTALLQVQVTHRTNTIWCRLEMIAESAATQDLLFTHL